jgi:hypothetical protein
LASLLDTGTPWPSKAGEVTAPLRQSLYIRHGG